MTDKNIFTKEAIAEYVKEQKELLKKKIENKYERPSLFILQVGDNPASNKYVNGKINDCNEIGIDVKALKLPYQACYQDVERALEYAEDCDAIIIQLPLPNHLEKFLPDFLRCVTPAQDVDGFKHHSQYEPCTPLGICNYLEYQYGREWFEGKHAVIVGRSDLVGKPLAKMLLDRNCTVTVAHSKTRNLQHVTSQADILVSATGKMNLITKNHIKPDVDAVINVGFAFDENGKMKGDVNVEDVRKLTPNCMPIVGSTGLLTRLALLQNTVRAWELNNK